MIVGDPSAFAIESGIAQAYERLSFRALGFFVIHISGNRYGVHSPDATMLACSFEEVRRRIGARGSHIVPFATFSDAGAIAEAVLSAMYSSDEENSLFLGITSPALHDLIFSARLLWAPDGDEAFDDGSHVLQFDVGKRVRLIGFENSRDNTPRRLCETWLEADVFYDVLRKWSDAFEIEWLNAPKVQEESGINP